MHKNGCSPIAFDGPTNKAEFSMARVHGVILPAELVGKGDKVKTVDFDVLEQEMPFSKKSVKSMSEEMQAAAASLLEFVSACREQATAAKFFLLVLLSTVFSLCRDILPPLIQIWAGNLFAVPEPAAVLLRAVQGPEEWHGKSWRVKRPWVVKPSYGKFCASVSGSLQDYIGGRVEDELGRNRKLVLPMLNCSYLLLSTVPAEVSRDIRKASCFSVAFCTGVKAQKEDDLSLDLSTLDCFDPEAVSRLADYEDEIYLLIFQFRCWLAAKKKRRKAFLNGRTRYLPHRAMGRYRQVDNSLPATVWALALSLFSCFLDFLEEEGLLAEVDREDLELRIWGLVSPETAPSHAGVHLGGQWNSIDTICRFALSLVEDSNCEITMPDASRTPTAVGVIWEQDSKFYLVLPRDATYGSYCSWLSDEGLDAPQPDSEWVKEMDTLLFGRVPGMKRNSDSNSWKFKFNGEKGIPCLGIPLKVLPPPLKKALRDRFGEAFDRWCPMPDVETAPRTETADDSRAKGAKNG